MGSKLVLFEDNSAEIKKKLKSQLIAFLYESGKLIEADTKQLTRVDTGQLKNSFRTVVDETKLKAVIGSDQENSYWEEYGTGEYALKGDGRKGGWFINAEDLNPRTRALFDGKYHKKRIYGKNGMIFYFTKGKKPRRMMHKAFNKNRKAIKNRAKEIMK
ncbi:MAG: hypothetical protein ACRCUS_06905 [Anaerovoracaceae bacterium]